MRSAGSRHSKNFDLGERLERYREGIEFDPRAVAGKWLETHGTGCRSVQVDLGCGKGAFTIESARRHRDILFIGIDHEPFCIVYAAQKKVECRLPNVMFVVASAVEIPHLFGTGEVEKIHLNFPTPFPRKKVAHKRVVNYERLLDYRNVLRPDGIVQLRTDSQPLRDFTLTQLEIAGYHVIANAEDAHEDPAFRTEPMTEYEERLCEQGATILGVQAQLGPLPEHVEQTAPLGLVHYLPDDLASMTYVPYGMGPTVENLLNAQRKQQRREGRRQ